MANGLWPSLCQAGLAANRPTSADEFPANTFFQYLATDTGVLSIWNPVTNSWSVGSAPQLVVAAGQTQNSATPLLGTKNVVTAYATATHNGVQLPIAATGLVVLVASGVTPGGVKVYPAPGGKIGASATNVADATNLAALKVNEYVGVNKTLWAVQRGA